MRTLARTVSLTALMLVAFFVPGHTLAGQTLDLDRPDVRSFITRMETEHGIPAAESERVLAQAEIQPRIVEAISRPAVKVKPWHHLRPAKPSAPGSNGWTANRKWPERKSSAPTTGHTMR